jgi:hypothetical protein
MWLWYALFIEPKTEEDNSSLLSRVSLLPHLLIFHLRANQSHATNLILGFPVENGLSVTVKYKNFLIEAISTKILPLIEVISNEMLAISKDH